MYSNAIIIEIANDEESLESNNSHYCFDVITENNNKKTNYVISMFFTPLNI